MNNKSEGIYNKLFQALEEGKKKEETSIVEHIRKKYRIPKHAKASRFLADHVPEAEVFAEVVNYLAPFAQILREIYLFLDRHRSTILGKADQFAFHFEELENRVPFGLDSFPKTYLDVISTGLFEISSFDPAATGRLLVDGPDYWRETGALENLNYHLLVSSLIYLVQNAPGFREGEEFIHKHEETIQQVVHKARMTVKACQSFLIYNRESDDDLDFIFYGSKILHFYYRSSDDVALWKKTLSDYNAKRINNSVVSKRENELNNGFRRFNITRLHELISAWDEYPERIHSRYRGQYPPELPDETDFNRYLNAFEHAFDLVLPRKEDPTEYLARLIEDVILPFWRHRWRLYEVWALVLTMSQIAASADTIPLLKPRPDEPGAFEWPIPHGDASHPVGQITGNGVKLEVWFQRKTPSLAGTSHIEPDIRIMTPSPENKDVFILELKDRHNGPIGHVRKVAQNYSSGSSAKRICIANYSSFRSKKLQGKLTTWTVGETTVYLSDQFKPGKVYPEVLKAMQESIQEALPTGRTYDLIVDVSGSVANVDVRGQVFALINQKGEPRHVFSFSDTLRPLHGPFKELAFEIGGGTELMEALKEYFEQFFLEHLSEIIILTDEDGAAQFKGASLPEDLADKVILVEYSKVGTKNKI